MKIGLIFSTALLAFFSKIHAQNGSFIAHYTTENGLPSNQVYCLLKDSKGFIWIATDRGVVRTNGQQFERVDFSYKVVFKIKEDSNGNIWFFTSTGRIFIYKNGKVVPYKFNKELLQAQISIINDAYVFPNDSIYLSVGSGPNISIDGSGKIRSFEKEMQTVRSEIVKRCFFNVFP